MNQKDIKINVVRSSMAPFDEYTAEIRELWDSHWLTNNGIKHRTLTENLKKYLSADNLTLFVNGHLALETLIAAFGLTGEVITTPFTFVSTTNAVTRNGLKPVFCDIREDNYTIDADKIEPLITEKTSAIIPVHVYGNICDTEKIDRIAKKYGLRVIYDAAHAFGVSVGGINAANLGDASMYSFHATKVFNTIEGGCATYRDPGLAPRLDCMKNFGVDSPENIVYAGGNAKMNEFAAAMGICNLRHVDGEIEKRRLVDERYRNNLSGKDGIKLNPVYSDVKRNFAYFPVVFDGAYNRDDIADRLAANGIFARKYFYPLTNNNTCYGFEGDRTPVAESISEKVLCLPMYADLSADDVDRICKIMLS